MPRHGLHQSLDILTQKAYYLIAPFQGQGVRFLSSTSLLWDQQISTKHKQLENGDFAYITRGVGRIYSETIRNKDPCISIQHASVILYII